MPPYTIIFDFDGTLADSLPAWLSCINYHANMYGFRKILPQDYIKYRNEMRVESGAELGVPLIQLPSIAIKLKKAFAQEIPKLLLHPGLKKVLERLYPQNELGILTSHSTESIRTFLINNGVEDFFKFANKENLIFGKNQALKKIIYGRDLNPYNCCYVGDEICDINAARDVGIKNISVTWGMHSHQALEKFKPDEVVDFPFELIRALEN